MQSIDNLTVEVIEFLQSTENLASTLSLTDMTRTPWSTMDELALATSRLTLNGVRRNFNGLVSSNGQERRLCPRGKLYCIVFEHNLQNDEAVQTIDYQVSYFDFFQLEFSMYFLPISDLFN